MKKSSESGSNKKNSYMPFPAVANYTNVSANADGSQTVRATTAINTSTDLPNNSSYYKTGTQGERFKYQAITTSGSTLKTLTIYFRRHYVLTIDCDANGGHFITNSNSNQTANLVLGDQAGEPGLVYNTSN